MINKSTITTIPKTEYHTKYNLIPKNIKKRDLDYIVISDFIYIRKQKYPVISFYYPKDYGKYIVYDLTRDGINSIRVLKELTIEETLEFSTSFGFEKIIINKFFL